MARPLAEVLGDLYARAPRGMRLGVEAMDEACARFDHPERELAVVHVAGTNGKGSVSAMLESAARQTGLRTGLYTSPHLARFAERIRVDGVPIDDALLRETLDEVLSREAELSFFEAATLAAFLAFRRAKVDLVVLEVGLGGRLDATNVVATPRACAVTRIAFDHQEKLGNTLEAIAREKAAIAKLGVALFAGAMPEPILAVLEQVTRERGGSFVRAAELEGARAFRERARLSLAGAHQRDNAMLAFAVARHLGFDEMTTTAGIERARWPGRLERIETPDGPILFDAAHNPDGAEALAAALTTEPPERTALVFGALADKDWRGMLRLLGPRASVRAYAPPLGRAAVDPGALAAACGGTAFAEAPSALAFARKRVGNGGLVVVAGSIALVGELRASVLGETRDPPVAL
jgi:dihydrofolate synthase/folylpolyglutamate synthase